MSTLTVEREQERAGCIAVFEDIATELGLDENAVMEELFTLTPKEN